LRQHNGQGISYNFSCSARAEGRLPSGWVNGCYRLFTRVMIRKELKNAERLRFPLSADCQTDFSTVMILTVTEMEELWVGKHSGRHIPL
jgi:hypothetical protein